MMRGDKQPARGFATRFFLGVARRLALIWLAPALLFNVDWTGHGTVQANTAAVLMILGSALFIEGALRLRSWALTPICVLAACFLVYVNTKQATRVLSLTGEAASEAKAAEIARGSRLASRGSQWIARRKVQVQLAGETSVGALEAQLQALQLSDLRRWSSTSGCEDVTARASGVFCAKVAEARAKIEAAKERDRIDAELAELPVPQVAAVAGAAAPVADAYVANVMALLREAGFSPSARLVKAEEAIARAFSFELLAALGPTCWLAFVNMAAAGGAALSARVRKPAKPDGGKMPAATVASAVPETADDLDRCLADLFEPEPAGVMAAKEIRPLVEAWFGSRGLKLNENKLWPRLASRFRHDPNNNRPRYFGLKVRVKGPPRLAVVSG